MTQTRIYLPPALENGRAWGFSLNLYALRSARNWGIGDFTDLAGFVAFAARAGADVVGVNPLHALHYSQPEAASPYSPTSRYFLNPIYVDVAAIGEMSAAGPRAAALRDRLASPAFEATLAMLRDEPAVAYARVARAKWSAFEACYGILLERRDARRAAFEAFSHEGGTRLERFAVYEALVEHFERAGGNRAWNTWPPEFGDARSETVRLWAAAHRRRVDYFKYVQWIAHEQLARVVEDAETLAIGLYLDVAVGVDPSSADVWNDPQGYVLDRSVGAPPDPLGPLGQNWGLAPPVAELREEGSAFGELLAANMRFAGALRLDHVMALARLFHIPHGRSPAEGAYVAYPLPALLEIAARESARASCLIVGEDLGTVPEGFRDEMERAGILSYRVFLFEREDDGSFKAPDRYPELALATATTHDLPSLAAWACGRDIDVWERIGTLPKGWAPAARAERGRDVERMFGALRDAGDLDESAAGEGALVRAVYRFLARSRARLVIVSLDDALCEPDPVNVPGTGFEYPNWRRKNALALERIATDEHIAALAADVRARVKGEPPQ